MSARELSSRSTPGRWMGQVALPALPASEVLAPWEQRLYRAGYWSLVALGLALPFEWTQRPIATTGFTTFTNLMLLAYAVAALAAVSLAPHAARFARGAIAGPRQPAGYIEQRRVAVGLCAAMLLSSTISSVLTSDPGAGLKWTLHLLLGSLIWLAVPLWLAENRGRRIGGLALAIVAGAVISAAIGIAEVVVGPSFARHLLWFKAAPTAIGPYLRLSGTFEYANTAALYLELALPFAVLGLLRALRRAGSRPVFAAGWLVATDILFLAVLLTYSRGAILGLGTGAAVAALAALPARRLRPHLRRYRRRLLGIAASLAIAAGVAFLLSPSLPLLRWTSSSDQQWYRATFSGNPPASVATDGFLRVPVTVSNPGPLTWTAGGAHPYHLSYHWLYPSGVVAVFEGVRSTLPGDIPPGHAATITATVQTPPQAGRYLFVWDMVQEGVAWFSFKSATYHSQPVRVSGPSLPGSVAAPPSGTPASLPTALPAPGRRALWLAALRMIATHPLFGVGPDGFRLNYGAYLVPKQQTWDERILANSLPLEIFADQGLVGGALFFGLLAASVWPLLVAVWRRRVLAWWQIAVIGSLAAFLGHGLVDYILFSDAIFFLFWLLLGLAATADP